MHVAIIMDGNGRWAQKRGLPRVAGHKRGADAVRVVVEAAPSLGIDQLTLFGFSSENWKRPQSEVSALMGLLRLYLKSEISRLHAEGVRLRFMGDRFGLADDIVALMADAEERTAGNSSLDLVIAINYGSRAEIVSAVQKLAGMVRDGLLDAGSISEDLFSSSLMIPGLPDPDLLIRTSGEQRISNFLLWQCAYTEFVFTDVLWPDFNKAELAKCLQAFAVRDRRFGALTG
ncbi:isoprenyl transferase [Haematospirillum sp. H1815]|uniref:isoprenyl transferase n=1 Tax=Haematospirillum sp. H1815 TaxID=2723108 RepID=UPI0024770820|nr:isoprenyl transferase [Haematospirillum sp. H1815]